ncbi:MAG: hypothetical protein HC875_11390 [Anaerolineales bacterium]|nr:hypothetical protein [Anaerolineales bacterium]
MDKQIRAWVEAEWANHPRTAWLLTDAQLIIEASSDAAAQWAIEPTTTVVGQALPSLFPELIGVEDILTRLAHGQGGPFELCRIYRAGQAGEARYFDLEIELWLHRPQRLLVSISDVTAQALREQQAQQKLNEKRLKSGTAKS